MEQLYTFVTNKLTAITDKVGFERVPSDSVFPYVTYRFVNSTPVTEGDKEDHIFEVDVWNKEGGGRETIVELETITKQIKNTLKKERHFDKGVFFLFEYLNTLPIDDEDVTVHRRQLRFRVRSYGL